MNRSTALLDWAYSQPTKPCLISDVDTYTWDEVRDGVRAAASDLADSVGPGTRVGLFIDSTPNFILYQYAVFYLGGVVVPINRALRSEEVCALVVPLGISCVIADGDLDLGELPVRRISGDFDVPDARELVPPATLDPEDAALVLQTSGSTGKPKGVRLSLRNLASNYDPTHRWIGVGKEDRILLTLPIFNTYALNQGINTLAMTGSQMRLLRRFSPDAMAKALREHEPTFLPLVPTMMTRLRQAGVRYDGYLKLGVGAAPSPTKLASDAWTVFPHAYLYTGYGLTEGTAIVSLNHIGTQDDHHDDLSSTGPVVSGIQVSIDDSQAPDNCGEILVEGDAVLSGYVGTDEPLPVQDGWLHTGDVGYFNERNALVIVDRIRELIIRGGQNIYPGEVEKALTAHDAVLESAVVGWPDADLGEVPVGFVVLRRGHSASEEDLRVWVAERLAGFKVPQRIIVREEMPKTPTGKIQKRELKSPGV